MKAKNFVRVVASFLAAVWLSQNVVVRFVPSYEAAGDGHYLALLFVGALLYVLFDDALGDEKPVSPDAIVAALEAATHEITALQGLAVYDDAGHGVPLPPGAWRVDSRQVLAQIDDALRPIIPPRTVKPKKDAAK